tara:strand:- start:326 stop:691 length:366 start_codon:yes stop_codon:yes gene_type:complete
LKTKIQRYPRLYTNISNQKSHFKLYYYDNRYEDNGSRKVGFTVVSSEQFIDIDSSDEQKVYKLNKFEFELLGRLIKKQEKVVEIYLKKNKKEQYQVVKSSLNLLIDYQKLFIEWFSNNKVL